MRARRENDAPRGRRPRRGRRVASVALSLCAFLGAMAIHAPARAWTDTRVETASASVDATRPGEIEVTLRVTVSVHGGWLEGFEIAGLDRGLQVDRQAITLRSDEGSVHRARLRGSESGRLSLSFTRQNAPRRGRYTFRVTYRAPSEGLVEAHAEADLLRWTFPGWRMGLDAPEVRFVLPRGARFGTSAHGLEARRTETEAEHTILTVSRPHLPRTVPWEHELVAPRGSLGAGPVESSGEVVDRLPGAPPAAPPSPPRGQLWTLWLGALALLSRFLLADVARRRGAGLRPVLPVEHPAAFVLLIALLTAGAFAAYIAFPPLSFTCAALIVVASLQRSAESLVRPRLGGFRDVIPADHRAARWEIARAALHPSTWLEGRFGVGFLVALGPLFLSGALPGEGPGAHVFGLWPLAVLIATIPLAHSAASLGSTPAARMGKLLRLAKRTPLPEGLSFRPAVHEDAAGRLQDARLRVTLPHRPSGLLRFDVVWAERPGLGGPTGEPWLLVVTRAASEAERIVEEAHPDRPVQSAPGGRRARLFPCRTETFDWAAALGAVKAEVVPRVVETRRATTPRRRRSAGEFQPARASRA